MKTKPNCGNSHDIAIQKKNPDPQPDMWHCYATCALEIKNFESCATKCISNKFGYTSDCAGLFSSHLICNDQNLFLCCNWSDCFSKEGICTSTTCGSHCNGPTKQGSEECKKCRLSECWPKTLECTGLPAYMWPDPECCH